MTYCFVLIEVAIRTCVYWQTITAVSVLDFTSYRGPTIGLVKGGIEFSKKIRLFLCRTKLRTCKRNLLAAPASKQPAWAWDVWA